MFILTLVMGDFVTVRMMSGGQSASVGLMMDNADRTAAISRRRGHAVMLLHACC